MTELPRLIKTVTQEAMSGFETVVWERGRNVHNDPDLAAAEAGIAAPFASGMMQLAYMHELLHGHFGQRWTNGGAVSARWLGLVFAGDVLEVSARVIDAPRRDQWWHTPGTLVLEMSCVNQAGTPTAVATAEVPE